MNLTFEQVQNAITFCSCFLSDCYIKKLKAENPEDIKQQAVDYLNDFNKTITYEKRTWSFKVDVPIEVGYEILGKIGIERPKDLEVKKC